MAPSAPTRARSFGPMFAVKNRETETLCSLNNNACVVADGVSEESARIFEEAPQSRLVPGKVAFQRGLQRSSRSAGQYGRSSTGPGRADGSGQAGFVLPSAMRRGDYIGQPTDANAMVRQPDRLEFAKELVNVDV